MIGLIGATVAFGAAFVLWLIAGLVAGWLAGVVVRGRGYGCCADIIIGWIGAIIGGFVIDGLFGLRAGGGFLGSILVAFIGALILLLLVRLIFGSSRT